MRHKSKTRYKRRTTATHPSFLSFNCFQLKFLQFFTSMYVHMLYSLFLIYVLSEDTKVSHRNICASFYPFIRAL